MDDLATAVRFHEQLFATGTLAPDLLRHAAAPQQSVQSELCSPWPSHYAAAVVAKGRPLQPAAGQEGVRRGPAGAGMRFVG